MSSSTDRAVVRGAAAVNATLLEPHELRSGTWTRLGGAGILGDVVTEETLDSLAASTMAAARAQGYATGWAEGRRAAAAEARARAVETEARATAVAAQRSTEHRHAMRLLEQAADRLRAATAETCGLVEEQATGLALDLVEQLVGHRLGHLEDGEVVRRALSLLPDEPVHRLRVHPDDVPSTPVEGLAERGIAVVADTSLGRGDAVVEMVEDVVDLRVGTAMDRVRAVLS